MFLEGIGIHIPNGSHAALRIAGIAFAFIGFGEDEYRFMWVEFGGFDSEGQTCYSSAQNEHIDLAGHTENGLLMGGMGQIND